MVEGVVCDVIGVYNEFDVGWIIFDIFGNYEEEEVVLFDIEVWGLNFKRWVGGINEECFERDVEGGGSEFGRENLGEDVVMDIVIVVKFLYKFFSFFKFVMDRKFCVE